MQSYEHLLRSKLHCIQGFLLPVKGVQDCSLGEFLLRSYILKSKTVTKLSQPKKHFNKALWWTLWMERACITHTCKRSREQIKPKRGKAFLDEIIVSDKKIMILALSQYMEIQTINTIGNPQEFRSFLQPWFYGLIVLWSNPSGARVCEPAVYPSILQYAERERQREYQHTWTNAWCVSSFKLLRLPQVTITWRITVLWEES